MTLKGGTGLRLLSVAQRCEVQARAASALRFGQVEPFAALAPFAWRCNLMKTDLPYALLRPPAPGTAVAAAGQTFSSHSCTEMCRGTPPRAT